MFAKISWYAGDEAANIESVKPSWCDNKDNCFYLRISQMELNGKYTNENFKVAFESIENYIENYKKVNEHLHLLCK